MCAHKAHPRDLGLERLPGQGPACLHPQTPLALHSCGGFAWAGGIHLPLVIGPEWSRFPSAGGPVAAVTLGTEGGGGCFWISDTEGVRGLGTWPFLGTEVPLGVGRGGWCEGVALDRGRMHDCPQHYFQA